MPKIDLATVPARKGSGYPAPFDSPCAARLRRRLGDAGGLRDFGVNLLTLPPGSWSSQRHWHRNEDEFVYVLFGEVLLVDDDGEQILRAGDCAAFPKNDGNGHHLINKSGADALCLEIGTRAGSEFVVYSDIDMQLDTSKGAFAHKDGAPYPGR